MLGSILGAGDKGMNKTKSRHILTAGEGAVRETDGKYTEEYIICQMVKVLYYEEKVK